MTSTGSKLAGPRRLALVVVASVVAACSSSSSSTPGGGGAQPASFTVHYHRPLRDYAGWTVAPSAGSPAASVAASGADAFGAEYAVSVASGATALAFSLRNGADVDPGGVVTVSLAGGATSAYVFSGRGAAYSGPLPALPGPNQIALYYVRPDATYAGWGLHLWGDQVTETAWGSPLPPAGIHPALGAGFVIPVAAGVLKDCTPGHVCVIAHKGESKDPGANMDFDPGAVGDIVFLTSGSTVITSAPPEAGGPAIAGAAAHLLSRSVLAWNPPATATLFELRASATADVHATPTDVVGGAAIALTADPAGLSAPLQALAPHLATRRAFRIAAADLPALEQALKGQLVAVARKADGSLAAATQVQTAFALDDLYPYAGPLGLSFSGQAPIFRVWAPTAQAVRLHVFDAAKAELAGSPFDMTAGLLGLWSYPGPSGWIGNYYQYELDVYHPATSAIEHVRVTDPWAVSLSTNGRYAQIVDLADPALRPAGWDSFAKPPLAAFEDVVVYEAHVRDFSALDPSVADPTRRGKFLAFEPEAATTSNGLAHLAALAEAGLTHLHLLPSFDFATVDEDPARRVDLDALFADLCLANATVPAPTCAEFAGMTVADALASLPGDSERQQQIAGWMRDLDSFNWGYDPVHFGVPEGSYASTAEGTARIVEFRRMVMGLARVGLRVVMDVVYNHTNASGIADRSVLDKVVPGYYHRRDPDTGAVLTSTCCQNTASEHRMMERLMIDTAVRWARDYKVDGFRLDLMGHHMRSNLVALRGALDALTPGTDGVDGAKVFLYGEGWDFGEVANDARGVNATQLNMGGTGIATFNDRLRDGVRGGGPFDSGLAIRSEQGFATGLYFDPNELGTPTTGAQLAKLLQRTDWIKIGMAGGVADFPLLGAGGSVQTASTVPYGSSPVAPTGYTQDPQESINYVSAHDNQVLFDIVQAKLPAGRAMTDRVRAQVLALATVALGEGIPFFHMGDDLLRSKSMDPNSYDSGDWFNRVDWSGQTCAWRSGRTADAVGAQQNAALVTALFADASIAPTPADIALARDRFRELLRIRRSSPLFRLRTKADVMTRVDFLNGGPSQVPGLIVMTVTDGTCAGVDLDPARDAIVVVLNATGTAKDVTIPGASGFGLHPILQASADPVARTAAASGAIFTVPARTAAVFEQPQGAAQGVGLPCNTRTP